MAKKLTAVQERALAKLNTNWQSSKQIGESSSTLWVLARNGLAEGDWRASGDYFRLAGK